MDIKAYIGSRKQLVDVFLQSYFSVPFQPKKLHESVIYSLSAGGKRIRPVLCIAAFEACGGSADDVVPYATALELIHTYSLIHDDLPAMDDDDLRRGKPTNHVAFGEGMAILAGDALLTEAFVLLSDPRFRTAAMTDGQVLRVVNEISFAAGEEGMVAGQAQDLLSENAEPDAKTLSFIHAHKTAALLRASVVSGGILAGADADQLDLLRSYGQNIGIAFQVVDDILDVVGETGVIGKTAGSDEKKKKMTYPKLYGVEQSKQKAEELIAAAIDALSSFDEKAEPLRALARYLAKRTS
ncbi:MAG: geranylgeranyl diphosphate synthase type II [Nitrospirae bacterium]|nr:MAG: geranylgeranyl diphosphate synthase type II [Nitrospirota bacterium]